jgi:hypothetical protein
VAYMVFGLFGLPSVYWLMAGLSLPLGWLRVYRLALRLPDPKPDPASATAAGSGAADGMD